MLTVNELKMMEKQLQGIMNIRKENGIKVTIGMGEVGIAAGARDVMLAILDEIEVKKINNIHIFQNGYLEKSGNEVIVTIELPGEKPVTYGHVKPEDGKRLVDDHIVQGKILTELEL